MAYIEEVPGTDAPASTNTSYNLIPGVGFKGILDSNTEQDWVGFALLAGKTYAISLAGADDNIQADTVVRVFNAEGEQLAVNDDIDYDAGRLDSMLTFSPEADGVYYLSAGAFSGNPTLDYSGSYLLNVVDMEDEDTPPLVLQGDEGNDVFRGGPRDDEASGGAGDDMLYGMGGNDSLTGNTGDDLLNGGEGADTLLGDDAPPAPSEISAVDEDQDTSGGNGGEVMDGSDAMGGSGSPGPLTREGVLAYQAAQLAAGNDTLDGGPGNDWLEGGGGNDELQGGDGDDEMFGDNSLAFLPGLLLIETLFGDDSDGTRIDPDEYVEMVLLINNLTAGDDKLHGGGGNDLMDGGGGDDELNGGAGDDLLHGGGGNDTLSGGAGRDVFAFDEGSGNDLVTDFDVSADRIDLSEFADISATTDLVTRREGDDLVIDLSAHSAGEITLQGIDIIDLSDTQFIFFTAEDDMGIA